LNIIMNDSALSCNTIETNPKGIFVYYHSNCDQPMEQSKWLVITGSVAGVLVVFVIILSSFFIFKRYWGLHRETQRVRDVLSREF